MIEPEVYWHVYPVDDLRDHITDCRDCWCHPAIDDDDCLVIHNSLDGRESYENGIVH